MIEDLLPEIRNIFVGRGSELRRLDKLWETACKDQEHLVYVFLNAPGVGKTTLINQFGTIIEREGKGLFLRLTCSSNTDSPNKLHSDLIDLIDRNVHGKRELIKTYINLNDTPNQQAWKIDKFNQLISLINAFTLKNFTTLNDIRDLISKLTFIIPVLFAADEIQEYQKVTFESSDVIKGETHSETALHYFTRILKDLINVRALLVLSGTRYHVLSQIGDKIGSPIRNKTHPLVLSNFTPEEVAEFVVQLRTILLKEFTNSDKEQVLLSLKNLHHFLDAFCGGHPRTIENCTELFLSHPSLLKNTKVQEYHTFMEELLQKTEEYFSNTILSSFYKNVLIELTSSEAFSLIKEWLLMNGSRGLVLNARPKSSDSLLDEELKRITYELMNIGIIVQNGSNNYYLTSYFHFLEFLKVYHEPYEEFLKQVLFNRFFRLMCGSHSGFGYTFEHVLVAALLIKGAEVGTLPFNPSLLRGFEPLEGQVNWETLSLEQNLLYHSPAAKAVDVALLQEGVLWLIQLTTAKTPDGSKLTALRAQVEALTQSSLPSNAVKKINGWVVSLFKFPSKLELPKTILITEGNALESILGKEICSRLRQVKESYSK